MKTLKKIKISTTLYEDELFLQLQNPAYATAYLEESLEAYNEDGDSEALLLALKHLAKAKGGITHLAQKTKLNRQALYKILSTDGNPRLDTFGSILHALGFKLMIVCEKPAKYHIKK